MKMAIGTCVFTIRDNKEGMRNTRYLFMKRQL